jgi:hypothetical protein
MPWQRRGPCRGGPGRRPLASDGERKPRPSRHSRFVHASDSCSSRHGNRGSTAADGSREAPVRRVSPPRGRQRRRYGAAQGGKPIKEIVRCTGHSRGTVRVVAEWATRCRRAEQVNIEALTRLPSARTVARLMTMARDTLSRTQTVTVAAIEAAVPTLRSDSGDHRRLSHIDPPQARSGLGGLDKAAVRPRIVRSARNSVGAAGLGSNSPRKTRQRATQAAVSRSKFSISGVGWRARI